MKRIWYPALVVCVIALQSRPLPAEIAPPAHITLTCTETTIDIAWDSVAGAAGYNIYSGHRPNLPKKERRKINEKLVASGPRFAYIWHFENGEKIRRIKGHCHYIAVTAVAVENGTSIESPLSVEVDNHYFQGFDRVVSKKRVKEVLVPAQHAPLLPVAQRDNTAKALIRFMEGPGRKLHELITKNIDPLQTGGCEPISTVLVQLLDHCGLHAYRIEGRFIKEYHSFVMLAVEGVEYVLDFAANQFIPDVAPVLIPRDYCHLDERAKLSPSGTAVYVAAKIYTAHQTQLSDVPSAQLYRDIYNEVLKSIK